MYGEPDRAGVGPALGEQGDLVVDVVLVRRGDPAVRVGGDPGEVLLGAAGADQERHVLLGRLGVGPAPPNETYLPS